MRKDLLKYYDVLGLSPGASPEEIKRSYRTLLHRWHPDLFKARSLMQTTAADITKELNEAYEFLIKKKLYRHFPPRAERKVFVPDPEPKPFPHQARYAYERAAKPPPAAPPPAPPPPPKPPKPRPAPPAPKPPPPEEPPAPPKSAAPRHARRWPWVILAAAAAAFWLVSLWNPPTAQTPAILTPSRALAAVGPVASPAATKPFPAAAASIVPSTPVNHQQASAAARTPEPATTTARVAESASWPSAGTVAATTFIADERPRPFLPHPTNPVANPWTRRTATPGTMQSADWVRLVDEVRRELETFEAGDSKARVIAIQGQPDEAGESVFRYGSSLVYFKQGLVFDWINRWPSLRVRTPESLGYGLLDTFTYRSSRNEVIRAQGQPTTVIGGSYYYGSSIVNFDREWVSSWNVGDRPLKARGISGLWYSESNKAQLPANFDAGRVTPRN